MSELKTEPGWKPIRRPWWAVALVTGAGVGAAIAAALGLPAMAARGSEPVQVRTSGVGVQLPPGTISLDDRLHGIEEALKTLQKDMTEVKARLPKKP